MNDAIKVLIADGDDRFLKETVADLKRLGLEAETVADARTALAELERRDYDVAVLEIRLPGGDGSEVLRAAKKLRPRAAVILLTAHGSPDSARQALEDGAFDYLFKPCSPELLARKIKQAGRNGPGVKDREPSVRKIMVPLSAFSSIPEDKTVAAAVDEILLKSFNRTRSATAIQETVHRSILVMDKSGKVTGIMTFTDLLEGLQPPYMRLVTEKAHAADSINLPSPNYPGMFTVLSRDLARKTVREVMSEAPPVIDSRADLMEAATRLINLGLRRLLVVEGDRVVGVLREQDLFFEMSHVMFEDRRQGD